MRDKQMHLTDEEIALFTSESLTEAQEIEIEQHLAFCTECLSILEAHYGESVASSESEWEGRKDDFVAKLRSQVTSYLDERFPPPPVWSLPFEILRISFGELGFFPQGARADTPTSSTKGETPDRRIEWSIDEATDEDGESGDLTVYVGSTHLELMGTTIRLTAGDVEKDLVFRQDASDHLGVRFVIFRQERVTMADNTEIHIEVIEKQQGQ